MTHQLLSLNKAFFDCGAVVHESTILSFLPPTYIADPGAILLHDYRAVYDSPSKLPFVCYTPYNVSKKTLSCLSERRQNGELN